MKNRRTDRLFLLFFGVIALSFFYKTFLYGALPIPTDALVGLYHPWRDLYADTNPRGVPFKNYLITDPVRQQIPWRKVAIDQWKKGELPGWNPYSFSGTPLSANIQAGSYYPFNVLFFFLDFPIAWTVLIMLQPLLAGLFLFVYLRHHDIHPVAALLGAFAWSFSGFHIAWLTWGTMIHVALWLPLILLSIDKLKEARLWWSVILAIALVAQFFAGHAQLSLYVVTFSIIYALWRREKYFWIPLVLSLAITSIQWIPLMQSVVESSRVATTANWQSAGWFLPWQHLVQFLAPDFFGNPATLNYWGEWNYGEFIGYIGILPLLFAAYAIFFRRDTNVRFWSALVVITLLFLLPTPLAKIPFQLKIPFLSTLQPTRLMVVVDFALVILAALGLDHFLSNKSKNIGKVIGIIVILLGVLWAYVVTAGLFISDPTIVTNLLVSKRNLILPTALSLMGSLVIILLLFAKRTPFHRILLALFVGVVVFDVFRFGWKFTPFTPKAYFFPQTQVIAFLQSQQKPFRVLSIDPKLLSPNVSAYYGIEDIAGYDPIIALRYEELLAGIARNKPDIAPPFGFNRIVALEHVNTRLFQLLGVRYILSLKDLNTEDVHLVLQEGETRIYEIIGPSPRVYFAQRYLVRTSKQKVIDSLFDPLLKPGEHAVVESEPIGVLQYFSDSFKATSRITTYSFSEIEISAQAGDYKRLLVILNRFDKGWHATIDGKSTDILRTNYIFQGIVVPPGQHTVRLAYE